MENPQRRHVRREGLEPAAASGIEAERAQWAKQRGGASGTARSDRRARLCTFPGSKQAGGASEIARSDALRRDYASFPDKAPNVSPNREAIQEKKQSGSEASPDGLCAHSPVPRVHSTISHHTTKGAALAAAPFAFPV